MLFAAILLFARRDVVTYSEPGARLEKFMPAFSQVVGEPLGVADNLKNEVICLRVTAAAKPQVLEKIASAFDATWTLKDGRRILVRTNAQVKEQNQREYENRLEDAKRFQAAKRAEVATQKAWSAARAKQYTGLGDTPCGCVRNLFLASIDPRVLAQLVDGQRTVFSWHPNSAQRPLPGPFLSVMSKLRHQIAEWNVINQGQSDMKKSNGIVEDLIVGLTRQDGEIHPEIKAYDALGQFIESDTSWSYSEYPEMELPAARLPNLRAVPISARLSQLRTRQSFGVDVSGFRDLLDRMADPIERDPMGVIVGPVLFAYVDAVGGNFVANLPDASIALSETTSKDIPLARLECDRFASAGLQLTSSDGWHVFKSRYPKRCRADRCDRSVLRTLLGRYASGGFFELDELLPLSLQLPPAPLCGTVRRLLEFVTPDTPPVTDRDLRLIASLTDKQRTSDQPIPFGALSFNALNAVRENVFDDGRLMYSQSAEVSYGAGAQMNLGAPSTSRESILSEPTISFPFGLPTEGQLHVDASSYVVVRGKAIDVTNIVGYGVMAAYEAADILGAISGDSSPVDWSLTEVRQSRRKNVMVSVNFSVELSSFAGLSYVFFPNKPIPWAQVDKDFRDEVDRLVAEKRGLQQNTIGTDKKIKPR